ncbi:glycosyltransferase family 39 protein [Streptococcus pneumoniae]
MVLSTAKHKTTRRLKQVSRKTSRFLFQVGIITVIALAGVILSVLGLHSLLMRTYMPMSIAEVAQLQPTSPWVYALALLFFLLLWGFRPILQKSKPWQIFAICGSIYALLGLHLIFHVDPQLRADAKHVFQAALQFNQGNFTSLTKIGAYLYRNPHQLGLVSLERFYAMLSTSPRLIFLINLALALASHFLIYKITEGFTQSKPVLNYTILLSFSFFPAFFFILFAYGTIPGLFFCLLSLYFLERFERTKTWHSLILSSFFIGLACLIRNNYQLFALTLLAILLLSLLKSFHWKKILAMSMISLSLIAMPKLLHSYYEKAAQTTIGEGTPKIAYITMGLMDSPKQKSLGGWYNAYNTRILQKNKFDEKAATKMAKKDLKRILKKFLKDPIYAFVFFYQKVLSTWTEPTFQSIWTGPQVERKQFTHTPLLQSIYEEKSGYYFLNNLGSAILLLFYIIVGFGLLFQLFKGAEPIHPFALSSLIFFLGGFVFHFFWETKSQYVYIYILLLMPYFAYFLVNLQDFLKHYKNRRKSDK